MKINKFTFSFPHLIHFLSFFTHICIPFVLYLFFFFHFFFWCIQPISQPINQKEPNKIHTHTKPISIFEYKSFFFFGESCVCVCVFLLRTRNRRPPTTNDSTKYIYYLCTHTHCSKRCFFLVHFFLVYRIVCVCLCVCIGMYFFLPTLNFRSSSSSSSSFLSWLNLMMMMMHKLYIFHN